MNDIDININDNSKKNILNIVDIGIEIISHFSAKYLSLYNIVSLLNLNF